MIVFDINPQYKEALSFHLSCVGTLVPVVTGFSPTGQLTRLLVMCRCLGPSHRKKNQKRKPEKLSLKGWERSEVRRERTVRNEECP